MANPYTTLEVPPDATIEVIKAAYRTLSRRYHPDRKGGSTEKMVAINVAYGILRDPETRERWDLTGDERPKPTIDVHARQCIMQMLQQIFTAPQEMDVYQAVAVSLRDNVAQMRQKLQDIPNQRAKVKRMRAKMKIKGTDSPVDFMVGSLMESLDKLANDTEQGIRQLERAIEMWREICDPADPMLDNFGRKMDPIAALMQLGRTT